MKNIFLCLLMLSFTACSSLTKVQKKPEALSQVKRVGIVGYSIAHQEPDSVLQRITEIKLGIEGNGDAAPRENAEVDELYKDFSTRLKSEMGWEVVPKDTLNNNAVYKKLVTDKTTGLIVRPIKPKNFVNLRPHQILDAEYFSMMNDGEKNQLLKDLGLDAIVIVSTISTLQEEGGVKKYIGMTEFRPRAQVSVEVIDGKSDKAIWRDAWAWGTGDKAVQSTLRFVDNKELMDQVKIAVRHGYDDLFGRYKTE